ncbi:MAG: glycosyltransferase family 2 protein [Clostridia bacterium]|nr:glycosyltransferase family 2 protein [Clostridia bacterium]
MISGLISVIIPTYNRANVIEECIASVAAQSYTNYEIIIADDGSTDSTLKICHELIENNKRIRLIQLEHTGVSSARNAALDIASGEYVFFLDSDDTIHPLLFETLVRGMRTNNAAIAGTFVVPIQQKNWQQSVTQACTHRESGGTKLLSFIDALTATFSGTTPLSMIGGVMMLRDLIGETRFRTDLHVGEDFYFVYQNLTKGVPCLFLKQKWYFQRIHANNSSWDYSFDGFYSRFLRRKLIWENEEAQGRDHLAQLQKRDAFGCFIRCFNKCDHHSNDARKMRAVLKECRKEILPALSGKSRIVYLLYMDAPWMIRLITKIKAKIANV